MGRTSVDGERRAIRGTSRHRRTGLGRAAGASLAAVLLGAGSLGTISLLGATQAGADPSGSTVYVGDLTANTVTAYAAPATGNVTPSSTLSPNTGTTYDLYAMALDANGDLWTANYESSTVTEYAPGQFTGTATPIVTLTTDGTDSILGPAGLTFDGAGDLWVGNYRGDTIVEFSAAQLAASGSPTPVVTIGTDGTTSLLGPEDLTIDAKGGLWVTNSDNDTVVGYTTAQLASSGNPAPATTITSTTATTSLTYPAGLSFDAAGNLWVVNSTSAGTGGNLVEYSPSQLAAGGALVPTESITGLGEPWQSGFDSVGNLWVATEDGTVTGYSPAQLASGGTTVTPAYVITGATTGLDGPAGLALKTAPTVTSVSPDTGPGGGGGTVTVKGTGFTSATTVHFDQTAATTVKVTSPFALTAVVPPGHGAVDVTATTFGGTSATSIADQFTYAPVPGYTMVGSDGGVFSFGTVPFEGSLPGLGVHVNNVVGIVPTADGQGYWMVGSDGGVFAFGDAGFVGSLPGLGVKVNDIKAFVPTPDGGGYWMVGSDGGVFAFGDAGFVGSLPGLGVHVSNIVGMVPTASGQGYWMVGRDGGVFAFGDAGFVGSLPGLGVHVNNVTGIVGTADAQGYWMVGSDGGVFNFGDATFLGSLPGLGVHVDNVVGIIGTPDDQGYTMVGNDGGVFTFGDAQFAGSLPGVGVHVTNVVGIAAD
jgi:hypothetical protein